MGRQEYIRLIMDRWEYFFDNSKQEMEKRLSFMNNEDLEKEYVRAEEMMEDLRRSKPQDFK